ELVLQGPPGGIERGVPRGARVFRSGDAAPAARRRDGSAADEIPLVLWTLSGDGRATPARSPRDMRERGRGRILQPRPLPEPREGLHQGRRPREGLRDAGSRAKAQPSAPGTRPRDTEPRCAAPSRRAVPAAPASAQPPARAPAGAVARRLTLVPPGTTPLREAGPGRRRPGRCRRYPPDPG